MLYVDALTFSINVMTSAQLTCNILTLDKSRVLQTFPRFKFLSFYFFSSQFLNLNFWTSQHSRPTCKRKEMCQFQSDFKFLFCPFQFKFPVQLQLQIIYWKLQLNQKSRWSHSIKNSMAWDRTSVSNLVEVTVLAPYLVLARLICPDDCVHSLSLFQQCEDVCELRGRAPA